MEKIKIDDLTRYKYLSGIKFAPDGRNACFVVFAPDLAENRYLANLWLYQVECGNYFQLTAGSDEASFTWLADSRTILFAGARNIRDKERRENGEELTRFYRIGIGSGEAREAFCIPKNVKSFRLADDQTILFTAANPVHSRELYLLSDAEKAEELKKRKQEKEFAVLDELPFWGNGSGLTSKIRTRLYRYDILAGKTDALSDETTDILEFAINQSGTRLVYAASSFSGKRVLENTLYSLDLAGGLPARLTPVNGFYHANLHFLDDETLILSGSDLKAYGIHENQRFYLLDAPSGQMRCLTPDAAFSLGNRVLSDCRYANAGMMQVDQGYLYFTATEGAAVNLYRIDRDGLWQRVLAVKGTVDDFGLHHGQMLFISQKDMKLQELCRRDESGACIQVTDFNELVWRNSKIAMPEHFLLSSADGCPIDGWILKPPGFDANEKYPAILSIHGGPKAAFGEVFIHEMQFLASEGYVVFFCNPRGSDGRGDDFADLRGKYGTIDCQDLMQFTDRILERVLNIDGARVGVIGGSYGGFMANWLIGHTGRFRAAVVQRGIANWTTMFATSDIGALFTPDQIGGTPWENTQAYWEKSPLSYADRVRTPTLFIHAVEDYRCWQVESLQMFAALQFFGIESRICLFMGENHELSRSGKPAGRIRQLAEMAVWFGRHLKDRDPDEKKNGG